MDMLVGAPIKALQQIGEKADEQFKGPKGYEVGYDLFSINGRMLGHSEPIRVKSGERVLFHVLNASATEIRSLALPGHLFRIVALDDDRGHGMGIVVEYAGQKGKPQWIKPKPFHWDYTQFGKANGVPASPDETI